MTRSLPEQIEQRFAAYGHQNDLSAWEIGWLTVWTFDYCTRIDKDGNRILVDGNEEEVRVYELYNIIAKATQVKSVHSVRNWHGVAKNVPPKLKEDYQLGLSHWKAIIPHCTGEKELRKMADIVVAWADDFGGAIISVAALRHKLTGKDGGPAQWEKRLKTATNACKKLVGDAAAPQFVKSAAKGFVSRTVHPPLP